MSNANGCPIAIGVSNILHALEKITIFGAGALLPKMKNGENRLSIGIGGCRSLSVMPIHAWIATNKAGISMLITKKNFPTIPN